MHDRAISITVGFVSVLIMACFTGCDSAPNWGADISKVPIEYRNEWVESIPMKQVRWAKPRLQRQGKVVFSGDLKDGDGFDTLLNSARKYPQIEVIGSDRAPSEVSEVLVDGVIANRAPTAGMVYWFSGQFDRYLVRLMLDSSNHVNGFILLTR